ncbi:hypothetical protein ACHQM5_024754 [Ranunculus cassubicifolius]
MIKRLAMSSPLSKIHLKRPISWVNQTIFMIGFFSDSFLIFQFLGLWLYIDGAFPFQAVSSSHMDCLFVLHPLHTLNYTRPHLVELKNSTGVVISNLTFLNSTFWAIIVHKTLMAENFLIQNLTILAPLDSPNTDGIDPDSSDDVCIEDCYISTGDDLIVIKSGWDEYGISYARPSSSITIRRVSGETGSGAGLAIGSEMSGGVSEVHAEDLLFFNSKNGIRIKTAPGRGGYIRNIYISNVTMTNVKIAIRITGQYGEHPDESYDPSAFPLVDKITIKDLVGENISLAGMLEGIEQDNFQNICLFNISMEVTKPRPWNCSYIQGYSSLVSPQACELLSDGIYPQQVIHRCVWCMDNHTLTLTSSFPFQPHQM